MRKQGHFQCFLVTLSCFLIYICLASKGANFLSKTFFKTEICYIQDRINNKCVKLQAGVRSLQECASLCQQNCIGVQTSSSGQCYHAIICSTSFPDCLAGDNESYFYMMKNPCQHNSLWDISQDTCKCVDGWVGKRCERLPKYCGELRDYGYPTTGPENNFMVDLDIDTYPTPVRTRCELWSAYDVTIIMMNSGVFDNNKTWNQYCDGYFYDQNNFWLGLDKIKAFSDSGLTTLYMSAMFKDGDDEFSIFHRQFNDFKLGDESSGFSFTFSTTAIAGVGPYNNTLTVGDCLGPLQGGKFSTWDQDNDEVLESNCAAEAGVGWWFKDCNMVCNPLGWNYNKKPGPERMFHIKMDGIDFESQTYAKTSQIAMFFYSE